MASRNSHPFRVLLLALVATFVLPARLDAVGDSIVRTELGLSGELMNGPEPAVGEHGSPLGVSFSLRRAAYPGACGGSSGAALVPFAAGWHATVLVSVASSAPSSDLFTPVRLLLPRFEIGPSFLLGFALGSGVEIDLGLGGGLASGRFTIDAERFLARRPLVSASLGVRGARERASLELRIARIALFEQTRRAFTTMSVQAALVAASRGGR